MSDNKAKRRTSVSLTDTAFAKMKVLVNHFSRSSASNLFEWFINREYSQLSNEQIKKAKN